MFTQLWTYFPSFSSVYIVDFEQVNVRLGICWIKSIYKHLWQHLQVYNWKFQCLPAKAVHSKNTIDKDYTCLVFK